MTEIADKARFDAIRYAQLWEDADILCEALGHGRSSVIRTDTGISASPDTALFTRRDPDLWRGDVWKVRPGARLVSIGSAGDNALAMLLLDPAEVVAVDLSAAQVMCIRLRVAAWLVLNHEELLELLGFRPSAKRGILLDLALADADEATRAFWENLRAPVVAHGAGAIGKFERYFRLFRDRFLPLVHSRRTVAAIFEPSSTEERARFLAERWNNWRWRLLLKLFFSRAAMGALGRDPAFFDQVDGSVPEHVARRIEHAFVANDPAGNPYLSWIMTGRHGDTLPLAFRPEHHATIAARLDRLRIGEGTLESVAAPGAKIDGWNLSDIFEYMSPQAFTETYAQILDASAPGARLVYWNMMAPRRVPAALASRVHERRDIADPLKARDKAFFYSDFVVEDVR